MSTYRDKPFRSLVLDTFDRLSAPVEHRYIWAELEPWFADAGLVVDAAARRDRLVRAGSPGMTEVAPDHGLLGPGPSVRRGAMVPDDPSLSICILVLERVQPALACLDSLRRPGAIAPGTELVVVANGTPADQLERLAAHEDVVLVVNREQLGVRRRVQSGSVA